MNAATGKSYIRWNLRMLDAAAGNGTSVDRVFALKKAGVPRGAKRKLKLVGTKGNLKQSKCGRMNDVSDLMGSSEIKGKEKRLMRGDVKPNISKSNTAWHGNIKTREFHLRKMLRDPGSI